MNHYSHRGQILPLKNQMVPTSKDTTFHASFDKNLNGFGNNGGVKPIGPTHSIYVNKDSKIVSTFGSGINPQEIDFHISLWARPDDTSTNQVILGFSKDGDLSKRLYLSIVSGHWAINIGDSAYRVDESRVENRWTFIEMEGSGGTAKLRLDGNLIFTTDYNTIELGDFGIGEKSGLNVSTYSGYLSDIRVRFDDTLATYYPCDEVDGYVLYDASGNGNDAISEESMSGGGGPVTASIVSDGKFGNAVDISNNGALEYPIDMLKTEEGTIAFWAKVPFELPHDGSRGDYLHMSTTRGRYGSQYSLNIQTNSGDTDRIVGVHWASESEDTNHVFISLNTIKKYQNGDWNHFIITWDKYEGYWLYLNGHLEARSLTNSPLKDFDANTLRFSGMQIDELRIENRMISNIEIKAWFESSGYHNHMDDVQVDDARAELEGLEVDGRNLLTNTDFGEGTRYWIPSANTTRELVENETAISIKNSSGASWPRLHYTGLAKKLDKMKIGQYYTLSFESKMPKGASTRPLWISDPNGDNRALSTRIEHTEEWQRHTVTFEYLIELTSEVRIQFWVAEHQEESERELWLRKVQFEKGNKASPYSPAPEDIEAEITKLN